MTKVHKILKFKQSDWLKTTLILIQTKEKLLPIFSKKIFFKLMNNNVFSRTMENLRRRINVKLVNNARDYKKYVSKPSFISQKYSVKNLLLFMNLHQF